MALAREPSGSAYLLPPDVKVTNTRLAFFLESGELDSGSPAYTRQALYPQCHLSSPTLHLELVQTHETVLTNSAEEVMS